MRTIKYLPMIVLLTACCTKKGISDTDTEWWKNAVKCDNVHTQRVGAVCNDGTLSKSTGAGTCSGHQGVDYWLCK